MQSRISALGLDIGKKRVGVAGCDGIGLLATPITTIERQNFAQDVEKLRKIIKEREVSLLVVGLPYSMDGSLGLQAQYVQDFAAKLGEALYLPIEYVDERLTSVEAEEQLKTKKGFSSRDKGLIDRQAAAIILQQWLDQRARS
ncbi:Holliday junction resolvase RuvX [Gloeocapsa sp. PCC 73106]|uniref:Holliday junction resolvase RuvX n=1 Tax=Gloeocapsa sp. PCC 73106 TaxID=102232 RepID=UPI0002AC257C|nr:Holliday junction resolvase RuvX [Gloeocapsa sp. PCC 73106]ELR97659.1 RNAse H-fold protein YqgF [Gloeocapsa sp. PCC 73106]